MNTTDFNKIFENLTVTKNDGCELTIESYIHGAMIEYKSNKLTDFEEIEVVSLANRNGEELTDEQIQELADFAYNNENNFPDEFVESDTYENCGVKPSDFY